MIIEVNQMESNFTYKFEIFINEVLTHYCKRLGLSRKCAISLSTVEDSKILKAKITWASLIRNSICFVIYLVLSVLIFILVETVKEYRTVLIPKAWIIVAFILAGFLFIIMRGKINVSKVLDTENNEVAEFYLSIGGILDGYYTIRFRSGGILKLRKVAKKYQYTLIFLGDTQIGQINKHSISVDNKNRYDLYLLDKHKEYAVLLSLFTVYLDNFTNHADLIVVGKQKKYEWAYNRNNKLYDPEWIHDNFTEGKGDASGKIRHI